MNSKVQVLLVSLCGVILTLGLLAGLRAQAADAADGVLYVQPGGSGACSSWADACTLQAALDTAVPGDEIWVAGGIHTPTLQSTPGVMRTAAFQLKSGVALYGGFAATETLRSERDWETNVTVLSGDIDGNDITDSDGVLTTTAHINGSNSFHVVTSSGVTETAVLDGLTVTGGDASGAAPHNKGGGMYNITSTLTLMHVEFTGNAADLDGGGMYNITSTLALTSTQFISNSASGSGGGMFNRGSDLMLTDVDFISNTVAYWGGGMHNDKVSNSTLTNVTFSGNTASSGGGGMYNGSGHSSTLTTVTFISNTASSGGGMFNLSSDLTLTKTQFISNTAIISGGGMYNDDYTSPSLTDVTFISNTAHHGGGMYNDDYTSPSLTDVDFISNTAHYGGGMLNENSSPTLTNCEFTNNVAGIVGLAESRHGGGMYNHVSNPTLINVTFSSNTAWGHGGGVYNNGSSPTLINCEFTNNQAQGRGYVLSDGGGMYNNGSSPTLTGTQFISNTAANGGGMHNSQSSPTLFNVVFSSNHSNTEGGDGGGMLNENNSSPALTNCTFSGNWVGHAGDGGGMYNNGSSPTLTGTQFISNTASVDGGGMYNFNSSPTLTGTQFISNSASGSGGGMHNEDSSSTLTNVAFISNAAIINGGGMLNESGSSSTLTNVAFISNTAAIGGGVQNTNSTLTLTRTQFISNTADNGGGMHNTNSTLALTRTQFISNTADNGGGVYNSSSSPTLVFVTFDDNSATSGGGMYNTDSSPTLSYFSFTRNQANEHGGGMHNQGSDPVLAIGIFSGNQADSDSSGMGGGMYNLGSSPELINTTFSGNWAMYGGGMANDTDATSIPSVPWLKNTILWGNAAAGGGPQIYNDDSYDKATGLQCMVEGVYLGCSSSATSPFVDADGVDNVPGTADDDLHLAYTSNAIDAGNKDHLPQDGGDLDGDGDMIEKLPFDLDRNPRCFADEDLDGAVDDDMNPCEINTVDLGAYEAQCYAWDMHYGYDLLEEGQKYRLGFHAETTMTSTVTIADTLDGYAAEIAAGNLTQARQAFETALGCAVTATEIEHAVQGLQQAIWELATGAMLRGNELLVQALDVTASGESVAEEIDLLTQAKDLYAEATSSYLEPLANDYPGFLAALQLTRTHPITISGVTTPTHVDLERLAMASAKKSRAYLELAERYFRNGDEAQAEATLIEGLSGARAELTLLYTLWPEVVDDANYTALLRNIEDMDRIYGYLMGDKNPFGYGPDFVPFHYHPDLADKNNYLRTKAIADADYEVADNVVQDAQGKQEQIDDNYAAMQTRLADVQAQYDSQLVQLCGSPDVTECTGGELNEQLERIKEAMLRIDKVLQQMENQNQLIRIEQERVAQVAGIHRATARLISDTGEELGSLAAQEVKLRESKGTAGGIMGILGGVFSGASTGGGAGPWGALAGGLFGGVMEAFNWSNQEDVAEDLEDVAASKERLYAKQKAVVQYADADIAEADSLALQRQYFLKFAELEIDYAIALSNLVQELARLNSLQTQAQYLLAEKAKARAFTALLYRDPAGRVLRDSYMELAHYRYERALDSAYRAGRALEYEINQDATFSGLPLSNLEDLYPLQDITFLYSALAQIDDAYTDWLARPDIPQPQSRTDTVYLSRVVGFEDTYDPDLDRIVTREEKFNAFVRDPANRVDRDGDGNPELEFSFQTSIYPGNKSTLPLTVFNDKVLSIKMRVRGESLSLDSHDLLQVDASLRQAGVSLIRTENSAVHMGGLDDVRAYNLSPLDATIQAAINAHPFPQNNEELFSRSVANTNWTIRVAGLTQNLNLDNIDEIELIVTHEAYTLQTGRLSAEVSEPLPTRPYQPMTRVLAPRSPTQSPLQADSRIPMTQSGANDLYDTYIGSVVISRPLYLTPIDLTVVLTNAQGSLNGLSGYISPTLSYPVTDQGAHPGPAVYGSWSEDSFDLQSEPFTTHIAAGISVTRQVFLHSGVISDSGEILSGVYSETLAGLTPEPMEIFGEFRLIRPAHVLTAAFAAQPFAGNSPLQVSFTDLSYGAPTDWAWSFGDGVTSSEQSPTHTYAQIGSYTVTLTISNTFALNTQVEADYIIVKQPAIYLPLVLKSGP